MVDPPYRIDLESIVRAFPPGARVPTLLYDFAAWLAHHRWGSVGGFALVGSRSDDAPIVDGAPLRDEFALFIRMPDGSVGGFWYGAATAAEPPIVMLGSEGEAEILADSLAAFLARIALRDFSTHSPWGDFPANDDMFEADDDGLDDTPQLAAWLRERLRVAVLEPLLVPDPARADLNARMLRWTESREAYWENDRAMHALARTLADHAPHDTKPWSRARLRCRFDGADAFEAIVYRNGPTPIPEAAAIEPIVRRLREAMARESPRLGAWRELGLALHADGRILPNFVYPDAAP